MGNSFDVPDDACITLNNEGQNSKCELDSFLFFYMKWELIKNSFNSVNCLPYQSSAKTKIRLTAHITQLWDLALHSLSFVLY